MLSRISPKRELNAFFTFFFDNLLCLIVMVGLLTLIGYPLWFIVQNIMPAIALAVLVGNALFSRMAIKLSHSTGDHKTALPLGIDIISMVPIILLIMGPALRFFQAEIADPEKALLYGWYTGMATSLWLGMLKFGLAFCTEPLRRFIPIAGMLGSIAGVAFVWLGANPILTAFQLPMVGMLSLVVCIASLMAHVRLPGGAPGAFVAFVICLPLYFIFVALGWMPAHAAYSPEAAGFVDLYLPRPQSGGFELLFGHTLIYLAIIAPLAILIVAIGTNIVAAAKLSGMDYSTRDVVLVDAVATFVMGVFGGIGQSTPYLGVETYKRMGAGFAYGLLTVLAVVVICFTGILNVLISYVPEAIFMPLLVIVSIDIIILAFSTTRQSNHVPAVIIAMVPAVINLLYVKIDEVLNTINFGLIAVQANLSERMSGGLPDELQLGLNSMLSDAWYSGYFAMRALSQGYILTAIFWGASVALIMDKKLRSASAFLAAGGLFSLFGLVHSVTPTGSMYLPWELPTSLDSRLLTLPYEIAGAYLISALFLFMLSFYSGYKRN